MMINSLPTPPAFQNIDFITAPFCPHQGVSMPIPVIGLLNEDKVFVNGSCVLNEERFMLIGSFVAFFIPLVIMVVTYCLTVKVEPLQTRFPWLLWGNTSTKCVSAHLTIRLSRRCSRGRPPSSCMRQRLPRSSLYTHLQWQTRCSLRPTPSTSLRLTQSPPQTHKVKAHPAIRLQQTTCFNNAKGLFNTQGTHFVQLGRHKYSKWLFKSLYFYSLILEIDTL